MWNTMNEKQRVFLRSLFPSSKPIVWAGSIRSGKSVASCMGLILHSKTTDGNYILAGASLGALKRNILPIMYDLCRETGTYIKHKVAQTMLEIGNARFHMFGANNEESQNRLQGSTMDGALIDEVALIPQSFVNQAFARCSKPNPLIICTMNKTSPYHWVKSDLVDSGACRLIESTLKDNPHISEATQDMYNSMFHGAFFKRNILNEWASATGCIYPEILEVEPEGQMKKVVIGADGALSGETAAVFLGEYENGWFVFDEYKDKGLRKQHAHFIKDKTPEGNINVYVDPAAPHFIRDLRNVGLNPFRADNKVDKGIETTQHLLTAGKVKGVPGRLKKTQSEITGYVWDEKAALKGEDKPLKKDDHLVDSLRYACMALAKVHAPVLKPSYL